MKKRKGILAALAILGAFLLWAVIGRQTAAEAVYPVEKIAHGWLYFRREPDCGIGMWTELRFGRCLPRYILCRPPQRDDLHACRVSNFLTVRDCSFQTLQLEGFHFLGNREGDYLITLDSLKTSSVQLSACRFSGLHSDGIDVKHQPRLNDPNSGKNSIRARAAEVHGEVWFVKWEVLRKDERHVVKTGRRIVLGQPDEDHAADFVGVMSKSRRGFHTAYLDEFDINATLGLAAPAPAPDAPPAPAPAAEPVVEKTEEPAAKPEPVFEPASQQPPIQKVSQPEPEPQPAPAPVAQPAPVTPAPQPVPVVPQPAPASAPMMAQPVQQPITQQPMPQQGFAQPAQPMPQQSMPQQPAQPMPQQVPQPEICPVCKGTGHVQQQVQTLFGMVMQIRDCPACKGRGTVIKRGNGAAITGLIFAILSMILLFVTKSTSIDDYTASFSDVKDTCTSWMVMFWIGTVMLVVAWVLIIVSLVKKNHGPVVITGIVFASIALIVLFVCMTDYSDVKDTLDMVDRYTSSYRGWNY